MSQPALAVNPAEYIRHIAAQAGKPLITHYIQRLQEFPFRNRVALLAVCPNSEAVARAAIIAAGETDAPILFAATLNQVDTDGGYTGWTPADLVHYIDDVCESHGIETPVLACLDHGGPWLKDKHATMNLSLEETMAAVKTSLEACISAGYGLLHIDPTVDRSISQDDPIPIDIVVDRTIELIRHAEEFRRQNGFPPIAYEVGTEEVHGGLADMDSFRRFLRLLDEGLTAHGIADAWPCFVVGKVGTDLHTTLFDPVVAADLTAQTRPYKALVKGHYSDYVDNPHDYPLSGMGGANVGPEFTEEEYYSLSALMAREQTLGMDSGLADALTTAVRASNRWQKWLQKDEKGLDLADLTPDRRDWIVRTCCRYSWTQPMVIEARARLYGNLNPYMNADAFVIHRIKTAILKYIHAFNLIDFNRRVLS